MSKVGLMSLKNKMYVRLGEEGIGIVKKENYKNTVIIQIWNGRRLILNKNVAYSNEEKFEADFDIKKLIHSGDVVNGEKMTNYLMQDLKKVKTVLTREQLQAQKKELEELNEKNRKQVFIV